MKLELNKIHQGDCLEGLKKLPNESVDCVVTSPPYWALRDYGVDGQLGLEKTFEEFISNLCDIFDEVQRVLKKEGTCWVNMGDTYFGSGKGSIGDTSNNKQVIGFKNKEKKICDYCKKEFDGTKFQNFCGPACSGVDNTPRNKKGLLQDKTLCMIPERFAIEMVNRGWILRNQIIWHKPNAMPSSAKDRFTVDFEKIFFFTKSKKYYFEQQLEECIYKDDNRAGYGRLHYRGKREGEKGNGQENFVSINPAGKNKRTVWKIATKPFKEAHFATYPEELINTPIKCGCPEFVCEKCGKAKKKVFDTNLVPGPKAAKKNVIDKRDLIADKQDMGSNRQKDGHIPGMIKVGKHVGWETCDCNSKFVPGVVLDPFFGSGTSGVVALKQDKKFIGFELNKEYIDIADKRLKPYLEQSKIGEY